MDTTAPNPGSVDVDDTSVADMPTDRDRPDQTGPMQTGPMQTGPSPAAWYDVPLARRGDDRKLGGVVAGICRAHGFDTRTTRIAVAVITLVLPPIALLYIAAWVLLPDDPAPAVTPRQVVMERERRPLIAAFGVLVAAVVLGSVGSWWLIGGFPWGLALIAGGVVLWLLSGRRRTATPTEWAPPATADTTSVTPPTPTTPTPSSPQTVESPLIGEAGGARRSAPVAPVAPVAPTSPVPARRRIPIASITLVAVALFGIVAQVGEDLDWWQIEAGPTIVICLAVVLGATVVSAIVNRSRALIIPLLAVSTVLAAFVVADPDLDGPLGERRLRLTADSDTSVQWRQAAGVLSLDLREVDLDGADLTTIDAAVGVGQLEIIVRDDVAVELGGTVNIGHILVFNDEVAAGVRVRYDNAFSAGAQPQGGRVRLDLEVGVGEITVVRTDADR